MTGYINFSEAAHAITDYIVGYYSSVRPHDYNGELPQTNRKTDTGKTLKPWPVLVDHFNVRPTKTDAGDRVITLLEPALEALKAQRTLTSLQPKTEIVFITANMVRWNIKTCDLFSCPDAQGQTESLLLFIEYRLQI